MRQIRFFLPRLLLQASAVSFFLFGLLGVLLAANVMVAHAQSCSQYENSGCYPIATGSCQGTPLKTTDCDFSQGQVCCVQEEIEQPQCFELGGLCTASGGSACVGGNVVPSAFCGSNQVCCIPANCGGQGGSCVANASSCTAEGGQINYDTTCIQNSPTTPYCCIPREEETSCRVTNPSGATFVGACTIGSADSCTEGSKSGSSPDCQRGAVCCYDPTQHEEEESEKEPEEAPTGLVPCTGSSEYPCDACMLITLADNILEFLIYLAVFVAVIAFTYAGFMFVTAGGNEGQITKAKGTFSAVAIGFIIVLASWLLVDTLLQITTDVGGVDAWVEKICAS